MFTVEIRLAAGNLAADMSDMRTWLDKHSIEPAAFSYVTRMSRAVASLAFRVKTEAEAFALPFEGRLVAPGPRRPPAAATTQRAERRYERSVSRARTAPPSTTYAIVRPVRRPAGVVDGGASGARCSRPARGYFPML
jgi:hypothetical protein